MSRSPAERASPVPADAPSLDAVIATRRSVRRYRPDAVSDAVVREIIDLARHAPSSMDGQPCEFVVVRGRQACARLAAIKERHCPPDKRAFPSTFVADAPVVVAVCVDRERSHDRGLENGVLATAFLLLAAASRGLSGVYLSARRDGDPDLTTEIRDALALPPRLDPITLVPLGYPDGPPPPKALRPLEEIVHHEAVDRAPRAHRRPPA
jgi:nitroreductase